MLSARKQKLASRARNMSASEPGGSAPPLPPAIAAPDGSCADSYLPLSALNDLLFCERRCAMHRIEQVWVDNAYTLEGTHGHKRADKDAEVEVRGVRAVHSVLLKSERLRLTGKADVVEFHERPMAIAYPVEYKRGRRRRWDNDDVQLCAQALCLEEMLGIHVPAGAIFHLKSKRRREIIFSPELRAKTEQAARRLHELVASELTPPPVLKPRCRGCSLHHLCLPELLSQQRKIDLYCRKLFNVPEEPTHSA
jgi:CRISPR-associated exonuclease Cas4